MKKINKLIATLLIGVVGVMNIGTVYADEPASSTPSTPSAGSNSGKPSTPSAGSNSGASSVQQIDGAGKVTVDCGKTDLAVGASTTCEVFINPSNDVLVALDKAKAVITMSQSKYITINDLIANAAEGFTLTSDGDINDRTKKSHEITLNHTGTLTKNKKIQIMSFRLKVEEAAKDLPQGQCGEICVDGAVFSTDLIKATLTVGDSGKACPNITITEAKCTGDNCNPKTGAFMNYAMVAGAAGIALVVIAVVTRKKKFYTV